MKVNSMKVGARNSAQDAERLQKIHDLAVENGASCASGKSTKPSNAEIKTLAQKFMVGPDAAILEVYDVQDACAVLSHLSTLIWGETDDADDVAELCALMRGLLKHIGGEVDEIEAAASSKVPAGKSVTPAREGNSQKSSPIAIPAYVKSLHLSLDEQKFKDVLAVKFIGRNEIRGYSNLWGDPEKVDLETEFFTNAKSALGATNFWDSVLGVPRPLTWNHAQDGDMFKGNVVVGEIAEFGDDEVGRFYTAVLDRSNKYRAAVAQLISDKALGTSSDSAPQYVERVKQKNGSVWLKTWPLFAAALTDVPCEPRMLDIGSPHWKAMGVDTKLLQSKLTEAGLEVSRDVQVQRLENANRSLQLLKLYAAE